MNELAAELPAAGVVRVVGPEEAGAGFLVSASGLIVTCAHVLAGCVPGATVGIEPQGDHRSLSATVHLLQDPPDVAVLRLTAPVPPEVLVLPLGRSPRIPQPSLRTFGYPQLRPEAGLPGELAFYGVTAADGYDQLALRSEEATLGFSGAPIWDPQLAAVVGMVKSIARGDPGQRLGTTAIGVPVEVIRDLCPELRLPAGRPYRGLEPFTQQHVDYYYGRDHVTSQLLTSLAARDFVPVVAISGGGKSSLLQAGLAKGLRDRPVAGLAQRTRCYQRVGSHPHAELLHSLAQHGVLLSPKLAAASPQDLAAAIRAAAPRAELIVVVDQFERLYTDCQDAERKRFVELLLLLATDTVKVVIGLRADFYHLALGDLGERLAAGQIVLTPMSEQDLEQVIVSPAEKLLRSFQPGLIQRLVADVRGRPGDLPLLQFALTEMWERDAASGVLTEETYQDLGVELPDGTHLSGAQGALIRRAEQLWQDTGPADQVRLQRILLGLIAAQPAETSTADPVAVMRDLSRPARIAQWGEADQRLIQRLIDARLLTADKAPAGGQPTVEVSHEALLRAWPRLQSWLKERSQFVQWRAQDLAPNLERWLDSNKGPEFLLPRSLLDPALQWLIDYPDELAGPPADYVQASRGRRTRRRGLLSGAVAVLVVASLTAAGIFYALQQTAVSQSRLARSEELAAEATRLLASDAPLAMLLSLQAYERAHTPQAESALIQAAQQPLDKLLVYGSSVDSVAFSPDGKILAIAGLDGDIGLWNVATGQQTATLAQDNPVSAGSVAFSPDGKILAVGDEYGDVGLWNVATRQKTATLTQGGPGTPVTSVAFSPDGKMLAAGDDLGEVGLWNVATSRHTATLWQNSPGFSVSIAFSPDGKMLAVGDEDRDVRLWNVATRRQTATLAQGSPVESVAFGPDGKMLAAGGEDGDVRLWDVATRRQTATLAQGNPVSAGSVAFSPDGKTLAAGDAIGDVGLWNVAPRPPTLAEGSAVESVAFGPGGKMLAAGDEDGDIGLWNVATGLRTATLAQGSPVESVAFSPGGKMLAAGDGNGDVGLWNVTTGLRAATLAQDPGTPVHSVAFSPDGKTLAVGEGADVGLWNVATRQHIATLAQDSQDSLEAADSIAFSPDGKMLAVGYYAGDVGLWNVTTRQHIATLGQGNPGFVNGVAFSPDGKVLAVGYDGGNVGLWDVASGQSTATLAGASSVTSVAFHGQILVTGDSRGNIAIWDAATAQPIANLVENGPVSSLVFSPNGQVLAIGGRNGNIALLWQSLSNLTQRFFMHLICRKVPMNLTEAQWAAYAPGQPYQKTCP